MSARTTHEHVTRSGLRVVVVPLPHLHTATLCAFVKVGSRFESPRDNGLSHFLEHMLFRGTAAYGTSFDLSLAAESLGAPLYADTGRDDSSFQLAVDPAHVEDGVELLAEVLTRPRFDDIELERRIVLEEMTEDYDERGTEINGEDIVRGMLFGDHPLGQRVIGPRANVERFTRDDLVRHHGHFYVAANTVLCAAGRVDPETVFRAAERSFDHMVTGQRAEATTPRIDGGGPHYRYVPDSGSQTSVNLLLEAVPETDPDYVASVALSRILDDGMSARLNHRVCDQKGLAYSIQGSLEPLHDVALLELSSDSAHASVAPLVRELLAILDELRHTPVTDAELTRVKQRYRFDVSAMHDDPSAMAGWFGAATLYAPPPPLDQRLAEIDAITAEELQQVARRIVRPDSLAAVVIGGLSRARQAEVRAAITDWR